MDDDRGLAHVLFPLDVDGDGWPPVGSERVWAFALGDGQYRIDNAPWFVRDLAVGDVVEAHASTADQHPTFARLVRPSDHVTIRIVCFRDGPLRGSLEAVLDRFSPLGTFAEGLAQYGIVSLDVPPEADKRAVLRALVHGTADGSWDWEEGRINDDWEAAKVDPERQRWRRIRNRR